MMMRALKAFDYGRRRFKPGDTFEPATDKDGEALALIQLAAIIDDDDDKPRLKKKYKTRRMQAEDE